MKYGILGIGQAGLRHFNAFNSIKNVKLLGFTEFDLKKAKKFEKKFNVKHFKKLEGIISLKPDFIIIALPHSFRLEPIKLCCKNNINLLIEKPLVLNTRELKIINKYISKKNLIHSISFVHRYRKEVLNAKKIIDNKKIGKVKFISETMISQKNNHLPNWIDNKKISGGGVLLYNAIHSIDKICFIADSKIDNVFANKTNINENIDVEDVINISLKFKNGVFANLIATFLPYVTTPKWETKIFGSSGQVDINIRKGFELISNNKFKKFDYSNYYKKNGPNYSFNIQAKSYIKSIKTKKPPLVNLDDGINSVKIVDAIYESIRKNKIIKMKY